MDFIFEVVDKRGRKIHLTDERRIHILEHKGMEQWVDEIRAVLKNPLKIVDRKEKNISDYYKYYKYYKHKKSGNKFLKVVVKYLNGDGFVITAHFVPRIN